MVLVLDIVPRSYGIDATSRRTDYGRGLNNQQRGSGREGLCEGCGLLCPWRLP